MWGHGKVLNNYIILSFMVDIYENSSFPFSSSSSTTSSTHPTVFLHLALPLQWSRWPMKKSVRVYWWYPRWTRLRPYPLTWGKVGLVLSQRKSMPLRIQWRSRPPCDHTRVDSAGMVLTYCYRVLLSLFITPIWTLVIHTHSLFCWYHLCLDRPLQPHFSYHSCSAFFWLVECF